MLIVQEILGRAQDARYAGRVHEVLWIRAADAGRRRLRAKTDGGLDVGLDLAKSEWLFDGAVLDDDGARLVVVARTPEPVMIVTLPENDLGTLFRIAHALGNRHAPVDLREGTAVTQVTETPELAARPILALGLPANSVRFDIIPFAAETPPTCTGAHHHG